MAVSINKFLGAGNLTRDPESRQAGTNTVAKFGLAINEKYKDRDGEKKEKTVFLDCEAWGRQGDLCMQYIRKGSAVFIEGKLQQDNWEDAQGNKRYKHFLRIDQISFLDPAPSRAN